VRLFIAINFTGTVRRGLLAMRDELRSYAEHGNFTLPENLHLTLVFLGECSPSQTAAAKAAMDAATFEPFAVEIERMGRFRRADGDIVWAGVRECAQLMSLRRELARNLQDAGFILENREYRPHITLGREVVAPVRGRGAETFAETVARVDLMRSERVFGKLRYTSVYAKDASM
jgi:2'-5' RNA ligase